MLVELPPRSIYTYHKEVAFQEPVREERAAPWSAYVTRRRPLYEWQRQSVDFLWPLKAGLCLDQAGLGKTAVAITLAAAAVKAGLCRTPAIVAPAAVLRGGCWAEELAQVQDPPKLRFVSYESLHRHPEQLADIDWLWADECHHLRGEKTLTTRALSACNALYRYGATATPFWARGFLDPMPFLRWQGLVKSDVYGLRKWCGYQSREGGCWKPWTHVALYFAEWLERVAVRHTRGVLRLPESSTVEHLMGGGPALDLPVHLGAVGLRGHALGQQHAAALESGKIEHAIRLARHWVARGRQVLLWARFQDVQRSLAEAFGSGISGATAEGARQRALTTFRTGGAPVMALTYGVGGEGWSLPEASVAILVDLPWTPAELEQVRSRLLRPSQTRKTVYYYLVATGTIDERIREVVCQREQSFNEYLTRVAQGGSA